MLLPVHCVKLKPKIDQIIILMNTKVFVTTAIFVRKGLILCIANESREENETIESNKTWHQRTLVYIFYSL